jgi:hypothetical protein
MSGQEEKGEARLALSLSPHRNCLPALKRLDLHRDVLGDEKIFVPRDARQLEQIQAAAGARGVVIFWSSETASDSEA